MAKYRRFFVTPEGIDKLGDAFGESSMSDCLRLVNEGEIAVERTYPREVKESLNKGWLVEDNRSMREVVGNIGR